MTEQLKIINRQSRKGAMMQHQQLLDRKQSIQGLLNVNVFALAHRIKNTSRQRNNHSANRNAKREVKVIKDKPTLAPQEPRFRIKIRKEKNHTVELKQNRKQKAKQQILAKFGTEKNQQRQEEKVEAETKPSSLDKKLKIGKRNKSNAMKEFILETLLKAKAQGTCYVMQRGTAQFNVSPHQERKSPPKNIPSSSDLVHEREVVNSNQRRNNNRKVFGANQRKPNVPSQKSLKNTQLGSHFDSNNKKWVEMMREFEKKRQSKEVGNEIPEQIEEECADRDNAALKRQVQIIEEQLQIQQSINTKPN